MVGRIRNIRSLDPPQAPEGRRPRRMGHRRDPSPIAMPAEDEEQVAQTDAEEEEEAQEDVEEEVQEDDEEEALAGASTSPASAGVYLRGPASLPPRPIPLQERPVIRPDGERGWTTVEAAGGHKRQVNGILGLLCKEHFPGMVEYTGVTQPAYTFDHYVVASDARDQDGREFANKAERVKAELWDFFRCQDGFQDRAALVATKVCKKLVKDMHYEARVQAVITYNGLWLGKKVTKKEAREMTLTRQHYIKAIPYWCARHPDCWEYMVDKWCAPEWKETHNVCRERRLMMPGVPHHQGSRTLNGYVETWSSSHGHMRVGGKKHGRHWLGDDIIDTARTPAVSQIRARSTNASPAIRPRPDTTQHRVEQLQAQLEEEKRQRLELEAKVVADQQRMVAILEYMQSLGAAQGLPLPPGLLTPPQPPFAPTPNQLGASNDSPRQLRESPRSHTYPQHPPHSP